MYHGCQQSASYAEGLPHIVFELFNWLRECEIQLALMVLMVV